MPLKVLGILGGMGPAATADLLQKIVRYTDAEDDQHHIRILVDDNVNIPDRTAAILHGGEDPVPYMVDSAQKLESIGADFLIMPCNTAHYFLDAVAAEVDIPFLSVLDVVVDRLREKGIHKAAVLATDGTVQSGIYSNALEAAGIEPLYPDAEGQANLMSLIYDYVKKGITERSQLPERDVQAVLAGLKQQGAETFLLACTELPIAFEAMHLHCSCEDPTTLLAKAAIREAGYRVKV